MTTHVGLLLYPDLTQLDLTGPAEVFQSIPDVRLHFVWKTREPVRSDCGLELTPSTTLDECPGLDIVCVPGGYGQVALMEDRPVLDFLRKQGETARWVTAVCTGSLLLGAAGLLRGYAATTHWAYTEILPLFGAKPTAGRVVVDRNRITAGGVTAGIDFGFHLLATIAGERIAKAAQLGLEYDPAPPFRSGHPDVADPALVAEVRKALQQRLEERRTLALRVAS